MTAFLNLLCLAAAAESDARGKLLDLYGVLRDVAIPGYDASHVKQRFVLQMPGKVLSYRDYFPGKKYIDSKTKSESYEEPYEEIKPDTMEKMFQLSDVVPTTDAVGGDTGGSLADLYEAVLNKLDVWEFGRLEDDALEKYKDAIKFLSEPIMDPDNLESNVS